MSAPIFKAISAVLTSVLGLVALVYIAGGAVEWARLSRNHLPVVPVISELPKELLVTVGLREVVLPSLGLAAIAAFAIFVELHPELGAPSHIVVSIALVVCWTAITFFVIGHHFAYVFGVAAAITYVLAALAAAALGSTTLKAWEIFLVVALGVGLFGASARVALEAVDPKLPHAVVCPNDGGAAYSGLLVGETSSDVYLGQKAAKGANGVILVLPTARIGEVQIGKSDATVCKSVPTPNSSSSKPSGSQ